MVQNSPLNPTLHACLERYFGDVQIRNAGVQMQYGYVVNPLRKYPDLVIRQSGEHYWVNCDSCGDERRRLSISANWYCRDPVNGRFWSHLIHCFNEDCYSDHFARESLYTRLRYCRSAPRAFGTAAAARQVSGLSVDSVPLQALPTGFIRLGKLPENHPAREYLTSRYFDVEEIDRVYGVGFCENSEYSYARDRIIIPAYLDNKLVGWQARHIGELDWKADGAPPKYFTCPGMKRGSVVYNIDRAKHYRTVVIVEGPTDAWNVGPMAVAIWGSTVTSQQKVRLARDCGKANAVLLLDPEIMNPTTASYAKIKMRNLLGLERVFAGGLALVALPYGTDPGSLDRTWLRQYITEQAAEGGVTVELTKW
jgi:hypothetical protein